MNKVVVVLFEGEVFGVFSNKDKAINALENHYERYSQDREGFSTAYVKSKFEESIEFFIEEIQ